MVVTLSFHFYTLQIPWDKRQLTADCATTRTVHTTICEAVRNKTGHLLEAHQSAKTYWINSCSAGVTFLRPKSCKTLI